MSYNFQSLILTRIFKGKNKHKDYKNELEQVQTAFESNHRIQSMPYLKYIFCRLSEKRKAYHRKLQTAESKLLRELDLSRFLQKQKMQTIAILSLLSGP